MATIEIPSLTAPSSPQVLDPDDLCTIIGVTRDGIEVTLGQGPLQPVAKARDILRSYGFTDLEDESSQDGYALIAVQELVAWMIKVGWQAPPLVTIPVAQIAAGSPRPFGCRR